MACGSKRRLVPRDIAYKAMRLQTFLNQSEVSVSRRSKISCFVLAVAATSVSSSPAGAATYYRQSQAQVNFTNSTPVLIVSANIPKGNWIVSTTAEASDLTRAPQATTIACWLALNGQKQDEVDVGNGPTGGYPLPYSIVNQLVVTLSQTTAIELYCEDELGVPNVLIAQGATLIVSPAGNLK